METENRGGIPKQESRAVDWSVMFHIMQVAGASSLNQHKIHLIYIGGT